MKLQLKKRRLIPVALAILVLVVGSGVAYAYWTSGGTGNGTANAAAGVSPLTVNGPTLTSMFPGDSLQPISGTFGNTNTAATYVTSVTVSITVTKNSVLLGTCDTTDFDLKNPVANVNALIPIGDPVGTWSGPTIQFLNKDSNQDACKGATVNLTYTIS